MHHLQLQGQYQYLKALHNKTTKKQMRRLTYSKEPTAITAAITMKTHQILDNK